MMRSLALGFAATAAAAAAATVVGRADTCPVYDDYASTRHGPYSTGKYQLPFQRPDHSCRTYKVPAVEDGIASVKKHITDPDLARLFENSWPNTVDTTILWRGVSADNSEEELTFVTTGDIHAMWLRDSANQLQSYKSLLSSKKKDSSPGIASLFRGGINLQGRYIQKSPYCNSFQPPVEAGLKPSKRSLDVRAEGDVVTPPYDPSFVFECKYELDSLAAFLQLSWDYYDQTQDKDFFAKFSWSTTIKTILDTAKDMMKGTYDADGNVLSSPYSWSRKSDRATETVSNNGQGEPVKGGLGLVRSFFRPSDDSCTFQYLIPSNMMFSTYLKSCAEIMRPIDGDLADEMESVADGVRAGIEAHAVVKHPEFGKIYAYEIDGFGSFNLMDDANLPSLLSIPHMGYVDKFNKIYMNTRKFVLSTSNRYYASGPVLSAPGGPHLGPGRGWPMGVIMQVLTSDSSNEMKKGLKQLVSSTSGLGLIHESVNAHNASQWTRQWFAWANGLFGQMILDVEDREPDLLKKSYQN